MQVLHGKEWPYEDKGSDFQKCIFQKDRSLLIARNENRKWRLY